MCAGSISLSCGMGLAVLAHPVGALPPKWLSLSSPSCRVGMNTATPSCFREGPATSSSSPKITSLSCLLSRLQTRSGSKNLSWRIGSRSRQSCCAISGCPHLHWRGCSPFIFWATEHVLQDHPIWLGQLGVCHRKAPCIGLESSGAHLEMRCPCDLPPDACGGSVVHRHGFWRQTT